MSCCVSSTCGLCSSGISGRSASLAYCGLFGLSLITSWIFKEVGAPLMKKIPSIISKLIPPSENQIISAIQNDRYYCFLVPLTLPVLLVAVYFHWLSMKLFKHA